MANLYLGRDELSELLDVPAVTIYGWWAKGHVPKPAESGDRGKQARFTLDEAFMLYVFSILVRTEKRKLREASVVARYLHARPGTIQIVGAYWPRPVTITVFPNYDIAGFNLSLEWFEQRELEAKERRDAFRAHQEMAGKMPNDKWVEINLSMVKMDSIDRVWEGCYEVDQKASKDRKSQVRESDDRATRVSGILKSYKDLQYRTGKTIVNDFYVLATTWPEEPDGIRLKLEVESWALAHIDEAIAINPFRHSLEAQPEQSFTADVTEAVEKVWALAQEQ